MFTRQIGFYCIGQRVYLLKKIGDEIQIPMSDISESPFSVAVSKLLPMRDLCWLHPATPEVMLQATMAGFTAYHTGDNGSCVPPRLASLDRRLPKKRWSDACCQRQSTCNAEIFTEPEGSLSKSRSGCTLDWCPRQAVQENTDVRGSVVGRGTAHVWS